MSLEDKNRPVFCGIQANPGHKVPVFEQTCL